MFKYAWTMAGLVVFLTGTGLAGTEPLAVSVADKAPIIDGVLDDACWQTAAKIDTLYLPNSDTPVKDTTIYMARDNTWLFIAVTVRTRT